MEQTKYKADDNNGEQTLGEWALHGYMFIRRTNLKQFGNMRIKFGIYAF